MRVVVDASVAVKWAFPFRDNEADCDKAIALLDSFRKGEIELLQPPHWLAEVSAVLTRQSPETAREYVEILHALWIPVTHEPEMYALACEISASTGQHVFDTLYHAVALLAPPCMLVTADVRYYKRARSIGSIVALKDFDLIPAKARS
jgi:predicted nucleic acid-binding protein